MADMQVLMQEAEQPENAERLDALMDEIFFLDHVSKIKTEQWLWLWDQVKLSLEAIKERQARLRHVFACANNMGEKMAQRLEDIIDQRDGEPLYGETGKFCLEKNGGVPALDIDVSGLEDRIRISKALEYTVVKGKDLIPPNWVYHIPVLDLEEMRKDLSRLDRNFDDPGFARLKPRGKHIRVRPLGVLDVRNT